jgi:hypothetical protein
LAVLDEGSRRGTGVFSSLLLLNFDINPKKKRPKFKHEFNRLLHAGRMNKIQNHNIKE